MVLTETQIRDLAAYYLKVDPQKLVFKTREYVLPPYEMFQFNKDNSVAFINNLVCTLNSGDTISIRHGSLELQLKYEHRQGINHPFQFQPSTLFDTILSDSFYTSLITYTEISVQSM